MNDSTRRALGRPSHGDRHEHELQALYAISQILATRAGQREMLLELLDVLERELGMVRGTIMLLSTDGAELLVEAARDIDLPRQQEARYQRGEGIMGRVLQTGEPAIVPRISAEPRFEGRIHDRREAPGGEWSFLCTPVVLEGEVVGTLSVDLPYRADADLEEDHRVLAIVARMIANDVKSRRTAKLQREALEAENLRLRDALGEQFRPENIIGSSKAIREVYLRIHRVAATNTTVLIRGESGTGKELVASAIHYSSPRAKKPFVKVNCAALNENLLESELFGHERGAFTGAVTPRVGRLEEAQGGTLFLDEIGDFSPAIQVKLLRVLQEREYQRVGSNTTSRADVRVIAATNRDLEQAVAEGTFRQDLYYRINVFPLSLPPLRERKSDILQLANHFVERFATRMGKDVRRISTSAINMMMAYHWPGNVRELENCIEHAVLLSNDSVIQGQSLPPTLQTPADDVGPAVGSLKAKVNTLEKDMIIDALKRSGGNVSAAARKLGITPRMVRYKIKKLGIAYDRYFRRRRSSD